MINSTIVEITDPLISMKNGNKIFTSLEGENPGGSIKDYMVLGEIKKLLNNNDVKITGISEVSSGSTARALAHYCRQYGFECELFVPDTSPLTLIRNLKKLGARIHTANLNSIYSDYNNFSGLKPSLMRLNQMFDSNKKEHYHSLADKIISSIGKIHAVLGAIGTGHSLIGLAEKMPASAIISAEPEPGFKVAGIRNIEFEKYGDFGLENKLDRRIVVSESEIPRVSIFETSAGLIEVSPSFLLVLKAAEVYLRDQQNISAFLVGAVNKRLNVMTLKKAG